MRCSTPNTEVGPGAEDHGSPIEKNQHPELAFSRILILGEVPSYTESEDSQMLSSPCRSVILVFLAACLLSACTTLHQGQSLNRQLAKQAMAEVQNTGVTYGSVSIAGRNNAKLVAVDGATIDTAHGNHDVDAGNHTLTLKLTCAHDARSPQFHNDGTIGVQLVAGHTYGLSSHLGSDTAKAKQKCVGGINDLTVEQPGQPENTSTTATPSANKTRAAAPQLSTPESSTTHTSTAVVEPPGFWQTPAVHGYGEVHPLPHAAFQPNPDVVYKILFVLHRGNQDPGVVNKGLERVATAVNLYVSAGVPLSHLKFAVIATSKATAIALDKAHYQQKYQVANPNLPLVEALQKDGVDILVCGQAVAHHHYEYGWINPHITVVLGALPVIMELTQKGYTKVRF